MAQVRKLSNGKEVPKISKGNINYNGTVSEFSDELYNSLVKNLDTSAASGIIRKGFDIGRQQGNTFVYDSEYNRAYVVNENGNKVWDYQGSIGHRSNFRVAWQGKFGRDNLSKNPNDVNKLLSHTMASFQIPPDKNPEDSRSKINTDTIQIELSPNNIVSQYDRNYTLATNRLDLINQYYTNNESFLQEYDFEDNPWKKYLESHKKDSIIKKFGKDFSELKTRMSNGTFNVDDSEFLESIGIVIKKHEVPPTPVTVKKDGVGNKNSNDQSLIEVNNSDNASNNNDNTDNTNNTNAAGELVNYSFLDYYLPQFYDLTVNKATGLPEHLWTGAKSYTDESGNDYIEFTNQGGKRYYVYKLAGANKYLRHKSDPENIFLDENTFWNLINNLKLKPTSPETWSELQWLSMQNDRAKTKSDGKYDVYGLEVLNVANHKIPIRRDVSENPNYYAKLKNGQWVKLSLEEYEKLKKGDLSVLNNKKAMQFYKSGGKVQKFQNAAGNLPVMQLGDGTYNAQLYQSPVNTPISGWDKAAILGNGLGTVGVIGKILLSNPKARRIANMLALTGYGIAAVGNTASSIKNDTFDWGDAIMTGYGLSRALLPRPKSAMQYVKTAKIPPSVAASSRFPRMWYGVKNYVRPGIDRVTRPVIGLTGTTFGIMGTHNFIQAMANDPNKSFWDWNTWTQGDARNFQMGMTGLMPVLDLTANTIQNARMRKYLPQNTFKHGSLEEIKFATSPKIRKGLVSGAKDYIMNHPIKEAFLGNPYERAYNNAMWNRPGSRNYMFTTSPAAIGLVGGLAPWTINSFDPSSIIIPINTEVVQPAVEESVPVEIGNAVLFSKGGKVLKMENTPGGGVPEVNPETKPLTIADLQNQYLTGKIDWAKYRRLSKSLMNAGAFRSSNSKWQGSFVMPTLEATKLGQSIATTIKNANTELDAIKDRTKLLMQPANRLYQVGYDFSPEELSFTKTISNLNTQFKNFAKSTSDNNQVLAGFGQYTNALSNAVNQYNSGVSQSKSQTDALNAHQFNIWDDKERSRIAFNNKLLADELTSISENRNTMRTQISKDINAGLNTAQDWISKDKMMANNTNVYDTSLNALYKQLSLYAKDSDEYKQTQDVINDLLKQRADSAGNLQMFPSRIRT